MTVSPGRDDSIQWRTTFNYISPKLYDRWHSFLQELVLCQHYHLFNVPNLSPRNPVLDAMLSSLLHVKLVAILDEALIEYLEIKSLVVPKKSYGNSLYGRICFLGDNGALKSAGDLHAVRDRRNSVAHESQEHTDWVTLETDSRIVEGELQYLGFVGPRPDYEFFATRSLANTCDPIYLGILDCSCGVKIADEPVLTIGWQIQVNRTTGVNRELL